MLSITKLQNLKAIHNICHASQKLPFVVINHKTTKFESNSQHSSAVQVGRVSCYQSQNYKIWKQFTTHKSEKISMNTLLSITKLQNLKAIHNNAVKSFENVHVVINHKTTKFESNSQHNGCAVSGCHCCYQSQNYKIWKQFTTEIVSNINYISLLSITKLQNLKAIHNYFVLDNRIHWVVINHKTTKFESNSQQYVVYGFSFPCCYQSQNYKIWKQFTTNKILKPCNSMLLSITKLQNLKAIHNSQYNTIYNTLVVINHKTTKFESNSQQYLLLFPMHACCYQSQNYKIWKQFTTILMRS